MPTDKSKRWVAVLKTLHQSDKLNSVSEGAELLYRRLLEVCDDGGNYYAEPPLLLGYVFAHRMSSGLTVKEVETRLAELENAGLVQPYDNRRLLHISNHYTRLRTDGHGADVRFVPPNVQADPIPESGGTPPGNQPDSTDKTQTRLRQDKTETRQEDGARGQEPAAPGEGQTASPSRSDISKLRDKEVAVRNWFAKCFQKVHGQYPAGFDPDDRRMSVQNRRACAAILRMHAAERKGRPGYMEQAELERRLYHALAGNYWKVRPPVNVAEFVKILDNCTDKALRPADQRKATPGGYVTYSADENPGADRYSGGAERRSGETPGGGFNRMGDVARKIGSGE